MIHLQTDLVEDTIAEAVEEVRRRLKIPATITLDISPVDVGIPSQALLTLTGWLEDRLEVVIPNSCYLFFDKKNHKQLTIKEAAQKLINQAKNGHK